MQNFAENRRISQIHPFSWKFKHLEGAGNRRKPQIFAGNRRFSQKTAGNRRLGSVTLGPSPLARPYSLAVISPPKHTEFGPRRPCVRYAAIRIGVRWRSIRSTWNCGMACESWLRSLNASDWRLAILPIQAGVDVPNLCLHGFEFRRVWPPFLFISAIGVDGARCSPRKFLRGLWEIVPSS